MSFFGKKNKESKKKASTDEFIFTLSNIDVAKIDKDFNIENLKDFGTDKNTISFEINEGTSLEKLGISSLHKEPLVTVVSKKKLYTYMSMVDIVSRGKLPEKTSTPCYGCHRKFSSHPLGIPIEFYPSVYKSKNDGTKIKKLTLKEKKKIISEEENAPQIVHLDYFDTDGIVCSFNCMITVIEDFPSPMYKKTPYLIYVMYKLIFGKYPDQKINKAPSWRLREEYEGPLSDEEFEKSLQTIQFSDTHQYSRIMNPVGRIFEAKDIDIDKQISII